MLRPVACLLAAPAPARDWKPNVVLAMADDTGPAHNVGGAGSDFSNRAGKLRGRKGSVCEGGGRVPFTAPMPGTVRAGATEAGPFYFPDVLPTPRDAAGVKAPATRNGISFWPALTGGKQRAHDFLYWGLPGYGGQRGTSRRRATWPPGPPTWWRAWRS